MQIAHRFQTNLWFPASYSFLCSLASPIYKLMNTCSSLAQHTFPSRCTSVSRLNSPSNSQNLTSLMPSSDLSFFQWLSPGLFLFFLSKLYYQFKFPSASMLMALSKLLPWSALILSALITTLLNHYIHLQHVGHSFMWNLDITPSDHSSLFTSISPLEFTITNQHLFKFLKFSCALVHVDQSESYSLVTQSVIHTGQSQTSGKSCFSVHFTTSLFHERRWGHSQRKKQFPSSSQSFSGAPSTLSSLFPPFPEKGPPPPSLAHLSPPINFRWKSPHSQPC